MKRDSIVLSDGHYMPCIIYQISHQYWH